MRNILLALMRIKDDFTSQKLMMTLYSVGSVICILVFMYFYVNVPVLIEQYEKYQIHQRSYTIFLANETEINPTDFDELDEYEIDEVRVRCYNVTDKGTVTVDYNVMSEDYKTVKSLEITIVLEHILSFNDNAEFINFIKEDLGDKYNVISIIDPLANEPDILEQATEIFRQIINASLIYVICFIACAYLFKYVFDSNRYENTIYSLIGASKRRVVCIMLIEAAILSIISSVIAVVINVLFYDILFININTEGVKYGMLDYLTITVFALLLSIITIIPFFITYLKNPIIKTKRECV